MNSRGNIKVILLLVVAVVIGVAFYLTKGTTIVNKEGNKVTEETTPTDSLFNGNKEETGSEQYLKDGVGEKVDLGASQELKDDKDLYYGEAEDPEISN